MKINIISEIEDLARSVASAGGRALLVGGAVRDALSGDAPPKDFDIEVYGLGGDELARLLARFGRVHAVGRSFGVLKLFLENGLEFDVSLPRRESKVGRGHKGFLVEPDPGLGLEEAASRRDFTINAMAYDPLTHECLDPFGGRADLEARVLRHVGPAFAEDPLRVLRGMQFAGRFDLTVPPETVALSRTLFAEHDTLSVERVWAEWEKWARKSRVPSAGLRFLDASGWMQAHPELLALRGCPQEPEWHPEGDVWVHTNLVTDAAADIAEREGLAAEERGVLVLASFCHDLGKPSTTVESGGRIRSSGHANQLAPVESFLGRIGAPARLVERILALVRCHLTHLGYRDSKRHVRRLARNLGESGETIRMLGWVVEADHSGRPPLPGGMPEQMAAMLEVAEGLDATSAAPDPLVLGRHLLELGHPPGPQLGVILKAAFEAQLDGAFEDLERGLAWVGEHHAPDPG